MNGSVAIPSKRNRQRFFFPPNLEKELRILNITCVHHAPFNEPKNIVLGKRKGTSCSFHFTSFLERPQNAHLYYNIEFTIYCTMLFFIVADIFALLLWSPAFKLFS